MVGERPAGIAKRLGQLVPRQLGGAARLSGILLAGRLALFEIKFVEGASEPVLHFIAQRGVVPRILGHAKGDEAAGRGRGGSDSEQLRHPGMAGEKNEHRKPCGRGRLGEPECLAGVADVVAIAADGGGRQPPVLVCCEAGVLYARQNRRIVQRAVEQFEISHAIEVRTVLPQKFHHVGGKFVDREDLQFAAAGEVREQRGLAHERFANRTEADDDKQGAFGLVDRETQVGNRQREKGPARTYFVEVERPRVDVVERIASLEQRAQLQIDAGGGVLEKQPAPGRGRGTGIEAEFFHHDGDAEVGLVVAADGENFGGTMSAGAREHGRVAAVADDDWDAEVVGVWHSGGRGIALDDDRALVGLVCIAGQLQAEIAQSAHHDMTPTPAGGPGQKIRAQGVANDIGQRPEYKQRAQPPAQLERRGHRAFQMRRMQHQELDAMVSRAEVVRLAGVVRVILHVANVADDPRREGQHRQKPTLDRIGMGGRIFERRNTHGEKGRGVGDLG